MIESMRRGGVRNPYALLNASGYKEGDSEETAKKKLAAYMEAKHYVAKHGRRRK
jgi:hypothetical protein